MKVKLEQVFFCGALILALLVATTVSASPASSNFSFQNIENIATAAKNARVATVFRNLYPDYMLTNNQQCLYDSYQDNSDAMTFVSNTNSAIPQFVTIKILSSDEPNAIASVAEGRLLAQIAISSTLMGIAETDDQLAFIIAHEMSHIKNDHFLPDLSHFLLNRKQLEIIQQSYKSWETFADIEASQLLQKVGYSIDGAKIISAADNHSAAKSNSLFRHPESSSRLLSLASSTHSHQYEK